MDSLRANDVAIGLPLIVSLVTIVATIVIHALALLGIRSRELIVGNQHYCLYSVSPGSHRSKRSLACQPPSVEILWGATGCADWLAERGGLETAVSREPFAKETLGGYWRNFGSKSASFLRRVSSPTVRCEFLRQAGIPVSRDSVRRTQHFQGQRLAGPLHQF
jgi:hypothetical protein